MELQATGLFTYSNADGWKDSIRASRATAVAHIILAGIEGVGFVTADLMAIKAGNMPLAAALWTAGTYVSGETLDRGINQLQGKTGEGQRVMDSFHPDTHPGDESLLESFAPLSDIGLEVAGGGVAKLGVVGVGMAMATKGEIFYKTTKEATAAAKKLGYEKTQYKVHGQAVYYNKKKKNYITRDVGSGDGNGAHNGGVWKMAKSIEELGSKKTRYGTLDANLNKIAE